MPRRRRIKLPTRIALPAAELERKMMATLRGLKECAKLKGVRFVDVGQLGQEPNWFAHRWRCTSWRPKRLPNGSRPRAGGVARRGLWAVVRLNTVSLPVLSLWRDRSALHIAVKPQHRHNLSRSIRH